MQGERRIVGAEPHHRIDFGRLKRQLITRARELLSEWLPGGKVKGHYYYAADLSGGDGSSLRCSLVSGIWKDFANPSQKGGDLIALYAAINSMQQGDAARALMDLIGDTQPAALVAYQAKITAPPIGSPPPPMDYGVMGPPVMSWCYRDPNGNPLFYIARYEREGDGESEKVFTPWSWNSEANAWVNRGWPAPRPLYGLEQLSRRSQTVPVLIVEGEKAADAARKIVMDAYIVVTWPGGCNAINKIDWSSVYKRRVLIWPDADAPGMQAGEAIASLLVEHCEHVKLLDMTGKTGGWDAADALAEGMNWESMVEWARPRARLVEKPTTPQSAQGSVNTTVEVNVSGDGEQKSTESQYMMWERLGLALTKGGSPIPNAHNIILIFEKEPQFADIIWYDEFHMKCFTLWDTVTHEPLEQKRPWTDMDALCLAAYLQREYGLMRVSDEQIHKAAQVRAMQRIKNEPKEWFESLEWDQEPRVDQFLLACCGCRESEYARRASANFWIGMVARIYSQGCQLDNMIVLEGAQGIGKTKAMRTIGGPWYVEAHESVMSKDFFMLLQGRMLIEIGELDGFSRVEVTRIKQAISCKVDTYRAPYDRLAKEHPRTCVFVGTTNNDAYLKDDSGARRFWPIKCGAMLPEVIEAQREQLFAEAVHRYKTGEPWWEMPADATRTQQDKRFMADEWDKAVLGYARDKSEVNVTDIVLNALEFKIGDMDRIVQMRVASILRRAGWIKTTTSREGISMRMWMRPGFVDTDDE